MMEGISAYFPPDLTADPDRIDVLYAAFRDKTVNPRGYESKLKTWRDAVLRYARLNKTGVIDADRLAKAFEFDDGRKPLCLNRVLKEMIDEKKLISEIDYRDSLSAGEKGWIPWVVGLGLDYLVKKPVSLTWNWAWSSILGATDNDVDVDVISGGAGGSFVCPEMVEELAEELHRFCRESAFRERLALAASEVDALSASRRCISSNASSSSSSAVDEAIEYQSLRRETKSIVGDEQTLSILLASLHRKGRVRISRLKISPDLPEKTFVFFGGEEEEEEEDECRRSAASASTAPLSTLLTPAAAATTPILMTSTPLKNNHNSYKIKELTEKEKTLLQLDVTAKELVRQIEAIHAEMEALREAAKRYLAKGVKSLALNALKRKKALAAKAEAREKSLENIEEMISKLRDVDSNKMVFAAYKDAVSALNKSLAETGNLDDVENTIDDMKEAMERQEEIGEALAGRALREEEDEDELELELDRILNRSEEEEMNPVLPDPVLPEVPTNDVEELLDKLCISPVKRERTENRAEAQHAS